MEASLPRPPKVENTRGVNEANSTARTRSPYSRFFSSSCGRSRNRLDRLMALVTPFDGIVQLIFHYRSYLPPMATLMT